MILASPSPAHVPCLHEKNVVEPKNELTHMERPPCLLFPISFIYTLVVLLLLDSISHEDQVYSSLQYIHHPSMGRIAPMLYHIKFTYLRINFNSTKKIAN